MTQSAGRAEREAGEAGDVCARLVDRRSCEQELTQRWEAIVF